MEKLELIATTTFGLEAIVKRELEDLNFEIKEVENGKVTFYSDHKGIAKANLWLRCADRVLWKFGEFKAISFDELFDKTLALPWSNFIPKDGKFTVLGQSVKSKLFSISDSQAIVKKAIVENLKEKYNIPWFHETGAEYTVKVSLLNDIATLTIDTSGESLHKRGYRVSPVTAPIKETLAAAMVKLSYWGPDRILQDPFCGSGTILIEAAMIGRNIAPGLQRDFASKHWDFLEEGIWRDTIREAYQAIDYDKQMDIRGSDLDGPSVKSAIENADEAGVLDTIEFEHSNFKYAKYEGDYGIFITNPPYGSRLSAGEDLTDMYEEMKKIFRRLKTWSKYVITDEEKLETYLKANADRKRILFNGRIKTTYFQFYGPRPNEKGQN
ncbi:MAG: class I SAM-dependent RNA methyltransferase [Tenericutes bacterium]|jgi:putative N6-adenine-specific DNA methylase|nr:class I SAM-dependent RNA methyltransferase [Mycoplasmatota bacterium]